jgi:hypothetical protein
MASKKKGHHNRHPSASKKFPGKPGIDPIPMPSAHFCELLDSDLLPMMTNWLTRRVKKIIRQRTEGHCHFCGDPVIFERRRWTDGDLTGYWRLIMSSIGKRARALPEITAFRLHALQSSALAPERRGHS